MRRAVCEAGLGGLRIVQELGLVGSVCSSLVALSLLEAAASAAQLQ
jgi:hypothetical protein